MENKEKINLIKALEQIKDFRRDAGKRYKLVPVLLIIIMSIISGRHSYRAIAKYAEANKELFLKFFDGDRDDTPSHVTIREVIKGIDFNELISVFERWALELVEIEKGEWYAIDGKALGSTVTDYPSEYQNFVSLVSVFSHKRSLVLKVGKLENKKTSEILAVQEIIKVLDLKDVVYTLDALHCQKKRQK